MTRQEFCRECSALLIYPLIALENQNIEQALRDKDDAKVKELLRTEF